MRLLLVLVFMWGWSNVGAAQEWKLEGESDGFKFYSRQEQGSPVVSFRGEGPVRYSATDIMKLLAKIDEYKNWMPLVQESKVIADYSPTKKTVVIDVGMPWPVLDRYFVNHGEMSDGENGTKTLEIKSIPSNYRDADKVEGWTARSYFLLTPTDDPNVTYMTVELNQDPRGSIPKWMVNWVQSSWPREFFKNLLVYIENPGKKVN